MSKPKKLNATPEEMSAKELKALGASIGIDTTKVKGKNLLAAIKSWEAGKKSELNADSAAVSSTPEGAEPWALGYHEGKKIMSKVPVELNGREYTDITTEDGATYRV